MQVPKVKPQYDVYWETTSFDFISPLNQDDNSYTYLHGVSWDEYDVYNGSWKGASLTVKVDGETYVFPLSVYYGMGTPGEYPASAEFEEFEEKPIKRATGLQYINIDAVKGEYYLCLNHESESPTYTPGSQHTIQFLSLETATAVYNIHQE